MRAVTVLIVPAALALALGACAPKPASQTVSSSQAGQVSSVYFGTVTALQAVDIAPNSTRLGAITGAIIGGAAGSTIGSSTAANVAGAAAGAAAGGAAGGGLQSTNRQRGILLPL